MVALTCILEYCPPPFIELVQDQERRGYMIESEEYDTLAQCKREETGKHCIRIYIHAPPLSHVIKSFVLWGMLSSL